MIQRQQIKVKQRSDKYHSRERVTELATIYRINVLRAIQTR